MLFGLLLAIFPAFCFTYGRSKHGKPGSHEPYYNYAVRGLRRARCSPRVHAEMILWPLLLSSLVGMGIVFVLIPLILAAVHRGALGGFRKDLHHTNEQVVPRF